MFHDLKIIIISQLISNGHIDIYKGNDKNMKQSKLSIYQFLLIFISAMIRVKSSVITTISYDILSNIVLCFSLSLNIFPSNLLTNSFVSLPISEIITCKF